MKTYGAFTTRPAYSYDVLQDYNVVLNIIKSHCMLGSLFDELFKIKTFSPESRKPCAEKNLLFD